MVSKTKTGLSFEKELDKVIELHNKEHRDERKIMPLIKRAFNLASTVKETMELWRRSQYYGEEWDEPVLAKALSLASTEEDLETIADYFSRTDYTCADYWPELKLVFKRAGELGIAL